MTMLACLLLPWILALRPGGGSERFDEAVLTESGRTAYRALLSIESAKGVRVGVAGLSDCEAPLYDLWDDPQAEAALRALLVEAAPAGRFLAHCGLLAMPLQGDPACLQALAEDEALVTLWPGGCVGYELPVREAVQREAREMSKSLRRHWQETWPVRRSEPHAGYEQELSPAGRRAMVILRGATYVDGSSWLSPADAIGPMGAFLQVLREEPANDAFLDLLRDAAPAARFYGAAGIALKCPAATGNALRLLEEDRETLRLDIEGQVHTLPVADAVQMLVARHGRWAHDFRTRQSIAGSMAPFERATRPGESPRETTIFERERLSAEQREAYDALARAEVVQLGRWQELEPSTRALFTLWDAEDAAGAFELLCATASPAGRLLALCGLQHLAPERARIAELALRKSGLMVRALAAEPIGDASLEIAVAALVTDGPLPRRLRSEWRHARERGDQGDPRRELSWEGFCLPVTITPDGTLENPFRLERSGFGQSLAWSGEQLLVGASAYIDPLQRGAVYVLRPWGGNWAPERTLLPMERTLQFGKALAASDSMLAVVRDGGTYGANVVVRSAVEIHERTQTAWTLRATFEVQSGWVTDIALTGSSVVVVGSESAFLVERGADGWERRELALPDASSPSCVRADAGRFAVGHASGVAILERVAGAWRFTANLTEAQTGPLGWAASLALQGERLLVGGHHASRSRAEGSVTVFELRDERWVAVQTLRGSDALPGDEFGDGLALDGDRLVVLGKRGPARLFEYAQETWRERARFLEGTGAPSEPVPYTSFGSSVCDLSGDTLRIGTPHWKDGSGRILEYDVASALARSRL